MLKQPKTVARTNCYQVRSRKSAIPASRAPEKQNSTRLGKTTPPQAARMNQIILSAVRWCRQKDRTVLEDWIIPERFENLMGGMAEAVWGLTGGRNWSDQTAFLRSAAGAVYMQELEKVQRALPW